MTHHSHRFDLIASLCCVGFVACWTVGALQIEFLTSRLDFWTQNAGRYAVACIFWLPLLVRHTRTGRLPRFLWKAAVPVACANLVMQTCWGAAFYFAEPGFVTLLNKTSVIWVASFSLIFFVDERALARSPFFWVGLICSLTGLVGVIAFQAGVSVAGSLKGAFFPVASSVSWAVYSLLAKVRFGKTDPRVNFAVITLYMVTGLGVLATLFGRPAELLVMDGVGWANLVSSGIIAIALGHVFYYVAIQRIGATIPAMTLLATPLSTIIASHLVYGETLTAGQLAFGGILLIGAAAAILAQRDLNKNATAQKSR